MTTSPITSNDLGRSATTLHLNDLERSVQLLVGRVTGPLVDIGCGFGGLSVHVAQLLGVDDVWGLDIDPAVLEEASAKGVKTSCLDVSESPLPYSDDSTDFVMSLGMMDYLTSYDGLIKEIHRVLRPGGYALIALPNLASWHNRLLLLAGYQPRDVEISSEVTTGIAPIYKDRDVTGHIHIPTVGAFVELMDFHGFRKVAVTSGTPRRRQMGKVIDTVDRLLSRRPTLARRFFYLGQSR